MTISTLEGESAVGALFVVSLPIGNDGDISPRAVDMLERVDLVLAEDTRRFHALGQRLGIDVARATSYHDHNEDQRVEGVLARLRDERTRRARERCRHTAVQRSRVRGREPSGRRGDPRGTGSRAVGGAGRARGIGSSR